MVFVIWCFVLYEISFSFPGSWEGVWLALLGHVALFGILAGVVLIVGAIIAGVHFADSWDHTALAYLVLAVLGGVAVLYGARRIERFIASRCIRQYLRRQAKSEGVKSDE